MAHRDVWRSSVFFFQAEDGIRDYKVTGVQTCALPIFDRRRKMPVSILLKAIGLTPESILANFFVNDNFRLMDSGAQMEFVSERLRGEVARFDITDKSGKVVVAKDKRVTARHTRELEQSGTKFISVPEDFLIGRVVAKNIVDPDTGEIIAKANEERSEERRVGKECRSR